MEKRYRNIYLCISKLVSPYLYFLPQLLSFDLHQLVNMYWALHEDGYQFYSTEEVMFGWDRTVNERIREIGKSQDVKKRLGENQTNILSEIKLKFGEK